jgi:hypothetical protein
MPTLPPTPPRSPRFYRERDDERRRHPDVTRRIAERPERCPACRADASARPCAHFVAVGDDHRAHDAHAVPGRELVVQTEPRAGWDPARGRPRAFWAFVVPRTPDRR